MDPNPKNRENVEKIHKIFWALLKRTKQGLPPITIDWRGKEPLVCQGFNKNSIRQKVENFCGLEMVKGGRGVSPVKGTGRGEDGLEEIREYIWRTRGASGRVEGLGCGKRMVLGMAKEKFKKNQRREFAGPMGNEWKSKFIGGCDKNQGLGNDGGQLGDGDHCFEVVDRAYGQNCDGSGGDLARDSENNTMGSFNLEKLREKLNGRAVRGGDGNGTEDIQIDTYYSPKNDSGDGAGSKVPHFGIGASTEGGGPGFRRHLLNKSRSNGGKFGVKPPGVRGDLKNCSLNSWSQLDH